MKPYTSYSSSSSSSQYMYSSGNLKEVKGQRVPPNYPSSLHSIRKQPMKLSKQPIAPMPPTPPKVYKVDPVDFMGLVQKLTGAPESLPQRLKTAVPPPLSVVTPRFFARDIVAPLAKRPSSVMYQDFLSEISDAKTQQISDSTMTMNSLGLNLSPSSYNWCAFPLLSPGTLSSFEQSTVL